MRGFIEEVEGPLIAADHYSGPLCLRLYIIRAAGCLIQSQYIHEQFVIVRAILPLFDHW